MGANIANEVAKQQHICESTLACHFNHHDHHHDHQHNYNSNRSDSLNERTRLLFHNEQCFRIQHTTDIVLTEICGAIKNCIALGAGYIDGLQFGSNTKAALLRVGLHEMYQFAMYFYPPTDASNTTSHIAYATMMESCGVADLITTCYSGRNRLCAETFAKERMMTRISSGTIVTFDTCQQHWEDIERRILNGQKIQGVSTVYEVYHILQAHDRTKYFPLLTTIYCITFGLEPVTSIGDGIRIHNQNTSTNHSRNKNNNNNTRIPHQRSLL
jgi:glycerol-3-phosphate dehydrogenase (NAD+)